MSASVTSSTQFFTEDCSNTAQYKEFAVLFTKDVKEFDSNNNPDGITYERQFRGKQLGDIVKIRPGEYCQFIECIDNFAVDKESEDENKENINLSAQNIMNAADKARFTAGNSTLVPTKATYLLTLGKDPVSHAIKEIKREKIMNAHVRFVSDCDTESGKQQCIVVDAILPWNGKRILAALTYDLKSNKDNVANVKCLCLYLNNNQRKIQKTNREQILKRMHYTIKSVHLFQ